MTLVATNSCGKNAARYLESSLSAMRSYVGGREKYDERINYYRHFMWR